MSEAEQGWVPPAVMSRALFFATLAHLLAAEGPLPVPALGTGGSEGGAALENLSWQRLSGAVASPLSHRGAGGSSC